jgi:hypothetical protein
MRLINRFPKLLSWLLAAVIVIQPAVTFPCTCKACGRTRPQATAKRHECCRKDNAARRVSADSARTPATCCSAWDRACCCTGASTCLCNGGKAPAPKSPQATLLPCAPADEFTALTPCVHGSPADIPVDVHPAWAVDFLPACVSASQRCTALCRWLF